MSIERTTEWFSIQWVCALFGESSSLRNMAWQAGIGGGGAAAAGEESMNVLYNIYFEEQFVRGIQSYHDTSKSCCCVHWFTIQHHDPRRHGVRDGCNNARWTGQRVGRPPPPPFQEQLFSVDLLQWLWSGKLCKFPGCHSEDVSSEAAAAEEEAVDGGYLAGFGRRKRDRDTHTHSLESWPPLIHLWLKFVCFSLPPLRPNPADGLLTVQWLYYRRMWPRLIALHHRLLGY